MDSKAVDLQLLINQVPPVFLLLPVVAFVFLYGWRKFQPYFKFCNHSWIDLKTIRVLLFGTESDRGYFSFQKLEDLCRKSESEGVFVLWGCPFEPTLVVFGEEALKFFSNESTLTDKPPYYNVFRFMGETAIFISSGEKFKWTKRIMIRAFYPNVIKNIAPVMNYHAACLVQTLAETEAAVTDQVEEILKNSSLCTFIEAAMDVKADTEENKVRVKRIVELFLRLLAIASYRLYTPWVHYDFMLKFFKLGREHFKLKAEFDDITQKVLEEIKEKALARTKSCDVASEEVPSRQKSLGEVLVEQHLKNPSFDMEAVRDQVTGILLGGYDTTGNTLMWCFWLLGHHQDIQQKAYEEVMTITNEDVEYEDGRRLTYLDCLLKETLRLYPPAPLYARTSQKDIMYGNRIVPKGTPVILFNYHMHRNPKLYPNPDKFLPERFAVDESDIKPWTLIPFAEGVRACIGKNFGMLEMKIMLVHVLRKFKIVSVDQPEDVKVTYEIILRSANPLRMKFIPR